MNENEANICDCSNCKYDGACCSSDAWSITLTLPETKRLPHAIGQNGQTVIASGADGYCIFRDSDTKKCSIYEDRPMVCKRFSCLGQEEKMQTLVLKHQELRANLEAKYCGVFVSFIHPIEKQLAISSMMVKDLITGKQIQIAPQQVYGENEEDVREKIKEIVSEPFKKEQM